MTDADPTVRILGYPSEFQLGREHERKKIVAALREPNDELLESCESATDAWLAQASEGGSAANAWRVGLRALADWLEKKP